jgi:UDP-glucose:(glucosyl)LPS beta-1,3-glucosyltransferase
MTKTKVSILTPAFNSEAYIHRLLDSILGQTYPNIEMFVINDGSTDNTEEIVKSYIPMFMGKGYELKCINQSNQGQAAAINNGLKLISGKYLAWPDSDDFYASSLSIEKMVDVLDKNDDYALVRTFANVLDEVTLNKFGELGGKSFSQNRKTDLFEDCLFIKNNFWLVPGDYMLKTDILFENYPDKEIYPSNKFGGQNWQLLLPLLYNKKCYTIEEFLYNVVSRKESHSRGTFKTIEENIIKYNEHRNILITTLKSIGNMPNEERDNYISQIHVKYELAIIKLLLKKDKISSKKKYLELKKNYGDFINMKEKIKLFQHFIFN